MLYAAVKKIDITPPVGIPMDGYWARKEFSRGVHDNLYASCLVFRAGQDIIVLIALDVIALENQMARRIKRKIRAATGLPPANVSLSAIQTHSGPECIISWNVRNEVLEKWLNELEEIIVLLVRQTLDELVPARFGAGATVVEGLTRNRMLAGGPVDEELVVARVDYADGRPMAVLLNYTCHPVVLDESNLLYSADFPGQAVKFLEETFSRKIKVVFTHGAAGNINPKESGSFALAEKMGGQLARAAAGIYNSIKTSNEVRLASRSTTVSLPAKKLPDISVDEAKSKMEQARESWQATKGGKESEAFLYALEEYELLKANLASLDAELQAIAVGDLLLVSFPGELYVETGLKLKKKSPFKHTAIIDLANGCVGYVPPPDYVKKGGYGVRLARWAMLASESCGIVEEGFFSLMADIR